MDRYLDDDLSDAEINELMSWVGQSDENADQFARVCMMDHATTELLADSMPESSDENTATQEQAEPLTLNTDILTGPNDWLLAERGKTWRKLVITTGIAAAIIIGVLLLGVFNPPKKITSQPQAQIARIEQVVNAKSANGQAIRSGQVVGVGSLSIAQGLMRIGFVSGASVVLEGPAQIQIIDAMHLRLDYGTLTAQVSDAAKGFIVDTATTRVVDRGTAFGVSTRKDGQTDVCVFDGEVDVNSLSSKLKSDVFKVNEGAAVRVMSADSKPKSVEYHTAIFERAWPLNSGVLQTTGLMRFVSPGPKFVPGAFEDNKHILVFAERQNVQADKPIPVDLDEPGEYARLRRTEKRFIEPTTPVRSYLIQLDPVGQLGKRDPNKTTVFGQITFDQPIVGLIASHQKLIDTDALFGHAEANYGKMPRGVEPIKPASPDLNKSQSAGRDSVVLAADKRTLIVNFAAGSAVDQIRVLVRDVKAVENDQ